MSEPTVDVGTAATEPLPPRMSIIEALTEIAEIVGAPIGDPAAVVMHVRELARESERVHARNRVVEERSLRAIDLLGGRPMR